MNYIKRYRMEISLRRRILLRETLPKAYQLVPWHRSLVEVHAVTKYRSFRGEIDASVFPCLGDPLGCRRLMEDIATRMGFCEQATWLIACQEPCEGLDAERCCGTVQGVQDGFDTGGIQNLGITSEHRGRGLGTILLGTALEGFRQLGLRRAYLEVTAHNYGALRLYQRLGFRCTKTVYKAVEAEVTT